MGWDIQSGEKLNLKISSIQVMKKKKYSLLI